jgi:prolyl oligopeptidase
VALHRAADGAPVGVVPLPGTGSLTGLTVADRDTPEEAGRLWLGWTDLVTPPQVHRFDVATGETVLEAAAPGAVTAPDVRTEQREFTSADGTAVRMFVISPAAGTTPRPALVTGYGGFGLSREPAYTASALAWVAAGGTYALVSLRGGGEEGEEWHLAGNRANKQNVFDDLHAAATALVDAGDTAPDRLAIMGGSNGGLLVGAALTQRPELYRAVVCSAPLLDMVRYERFSIGRTWNDEYGSADDPQELGWLLSYSPYHHVRAGVPYPAVLFTVFDSDTRVDPLHARKMCAELQHATSGDPATRPVLIRRETDVGHGARSVSRTVALATDQLAFLAAHTGLELT